MANPETQKVNEAAAKTAATAKTEPKAAKTEKKAAAPKDEKNGVVRPKAGTKTGTVWAIADKQSQELKKAAPRKGVLEAAEKEGINPSTAATQYGRWRKYHGLEGKGTEEE